jgi:hypothetical protein
LPSVETSATPTVRRTIAASRAQAARQSSPACGNQPGRYQSPVSTIGAPCARNAASAGVSLRGAKPRPRPPAPIAEIGTGEKGGRKVVVPVSGMPRPVASASTASAATFEVLPWSVAMPCVV